MESSHHGSAEHRSNYGSISLVKRMQQHASTPPNRHGHHHGHGYEPLNGTMSSEVQALRGSHEFRSRDRISRFLDHSLFGIALDALLAVLAIVFVVVYIVNTYIPKNELPLWLWGTEIICAVMFLLNYVFRGIYLADRRLEYIVSFSSLINLVVILPVVPLSFFLPYHTLWYDDTYWRFLYPVRFVKCYLELKAVLARCHGYMSPVSQFAILCYIQIICITAGAAGVLQIAETSDGVHSASNMGDWTYFNSFFNSILVFVTVQSPAADNPLSKFLVAVLAIVLILIVPYQISKILDLGKSFSQFELAHFKPSTRAKHILLCGDLTASRIDYFFNEVFHDDHDVLDIQVVIMSDEEPSTALMALLMDPFFEKRTSYIQGSILDVDDANRAACSTADAIFILSRRCGQEEHAASDHRTLMRVMAARRLAPSARIFAQMHLSSNRHLLEDLNVKNVLYFSEVMQSLLGQNCVCPGFSTFIYNLTTTSSDDGDISCAPSDSNSSWQDRYMHGACHELYSVSLPPASEIYGMTFAEVASMVYAECSGVILFAVLSSALPNHGKIILNPGHSYSCTGDETVFVIAKDRREAEQVKELKRSMKMPSAWYSMRSSSLLKGEASKTNGKDSAPSSRRKSRMVDWHAQALSPERQESTKPSVDDVIIENVHDQEFGVAPIVVFIASKVAFPDHVEYFIGPLRVKALLHQRPIVFVSRVLPSEDSYATFQHFRRVFFVVGDPFKLSTLKRAGVDVAHRIVIMCGEGEISEAATSELLTDAASVALHRTISMFVGPKEAPRVVTELVNRANVHFVSQNLASSSWFPKDDATGSGNSQEADFGSSLAFSRNFYMSPAFASGLTYNTSLCDSLMINQYFNPMIKSILREFIFSSWKDANYLMGDATMGHHLDRAARSSNTSSMSSPQNTQSSSLFAVEVPVDFVGKTFEYVYHYLLSSDGILAVGIYRCRPDAALLYGDVKNRIDQKETERSVPFGYVYVNPVPTDIITGNDLLYVLSHKQPCWALLE